MYRPATLPAQEVASSLTCITTWNAAIPPAPGYALFLETAPSKSRQRWGRHFADTLTFDRVCAKIDPVDRFISFYCGTS